MEGKYSTVHTHMYIHCVCAIMNTEMSNIDRRHRFGNYLTPERGRAKIFLRKAVFVFVIIVR